MRLLKKILLPVNPEYYTHNSLEFAIILAKLYESEIIPIHIIAKEAEFKSIKEVVLDLAKNHIHKVQTRIKDEGINSGEAIIEYGNHVDRISIAALRNNVNVILFGIGKHIEEDEKRLNHTIERVIRHCDKPVWAVQKIHNKTINRILCPVDFSEASNRALLNSIHLAQKFNAKLTVLTVFKPVTIEFPGITSDHLDENEELLKKYTSRFEAFLNTFSTHNISLNSVLRTGEPDQVILQECLDNKYDLLIMGTAGRTGLSRIMMGSVTEKVIRQVPCSFITTKSENIINLGLETKISSIEHHYNIAKHKQKINLFDEAIAEYLICLSFNEMHIPSLLGLAEVYGKKGEKDKEALHRKMATEIINRLFNKNINIE